MNEFKDKKIAVLGLGANNQHLAKFLEASGVTFDVLENWTTPDELTEKIKNYDVVFRTPGLPFNSQAITEAIQLGVEVTSQTKLFFKLCPAKIIGVTGTKGKGTTSSLIAEILIASGVKTWLAGNIGRDPFEFISEIKPTDIVVMELSSFQLQDLTQSPHLAVVLNITPDHLNHHLNLQEYIEAKSSIIKFQTSSDSAVLHPSLPAEFKALGAGQKTLIDPESVSSWSRKLIGKHNLDNIAAAATAARILGVPEEVITATVAQFNPLPHRLNLIRDLNGIVFIDDGFSTNIEPTIAAIESIENAQVLIIGGHDKGLDFASVGQKIVSSAKVKAVIVIGDMTSKILTTLAGFQGQVLTGAKNMDEIISQSLSVAVAGDAVIFSPGTSSFGMFKNEYDRAEQFVTAVNNLQ